jgi:PKD repeat protein
VRVRDLGPNSNQTVQLYSLDVQVATKKSWPNAIAGVNKRVQANTNAYFIGDLNSYATEPGRTITGYAWDLDGNGTFETSGARPVVQYTTNGVYSVKLQVTDSGNKKGTDTILVEVFGGASASEGDLNGDNRVDFADLVDATEQANPELVGAVLRSFGDDLGAVLLTPDGLTIPEPQFVAPVNEVDIDLD